MNVVPSCFLQTEESKQGLQAQYFNNLDYAGYPVMTQVDDKIDFSW